MQTSLRLLQGEQLPLTEEVTLLYDITPTWVDEREFDEAHRQLERSTAAGRFAVRAAQSTQTGHRDFLRAGRTTAAHHHDGTCVS